MANVEHTIKRKGGTAILMPITPSNPTGKTYNFKPADENEGSPHVADVTDSVHLNSFLHIEEGFQLVDEGADEEPAPKAKSESGGEAGGAAPADVTLEDADLDQLRAIYAAELGEAPRGNAGEELLRSRIQTQRDEDAATKPD